MNTTRIQTAILMLFALALTYAPLGAQDEADDTTGTEIGFMIGATHSFSEYGNETIFAAPGGSLFGLGGPLYISHPIASGRGAVRAETSITVLSGDGFNETLWSFGGYGSMFFGGSKGPYALAGGTAFGGDSDSDFSVGAGLGHLSRIGPALVLRFEGRYHRYFDLEVNVVQLFMGIGVTIG